MNIIYGIVIIIVLITLGILYYFYMFNTSIIRIDKNQIMEFKTSMDLTGLPIITFYQGKEKYNFLLDTGSNMSYVNIKSNVKVVKTGVKDVFMGAEGKDINCEHGVVSLYRDKVDYECNVSLADLDIAFTELKNEYGVTIVGILGNDFFVKYKYCLDFKELVAYIRK